MTGKYFLKFPIVYRHMDAVYTTEESFSAEILW